MLFFCLDCEGHGRHRCRPYRGRRCLGKTKAPGFWSRGPRVRTNSVVAYPSLRIVVTPLIVLVLGIPPSQLGRMSMPMVPHWALTVTRMELPATALDQDV